MAPMKLSPENDATREDENNLSDDGTIEWNVARRGPLAEIPSSILSHLSVIVRSQSWITTKKLNALIHALSSSGRPLKKLDCYDNKLTSLPESLGWLVSLTNLDCSYNKLTSLPGSLGRLVSLTKLDCAVNKLAALPESLGGLVSLTDLTCYNNKLTTFPESLGDLVSLKKLDCYSNELTSLPLSMGEFSLWLNFGFFEFYKFQSTNPLLPEFERGSWPKLRAYLRWRARIRLLWIGHKESECPFSLLPPEIIREIRDFY